MKHLSTLLLVLAFVACNRDPKTVARRYYDSGNKYFDRGKYKEAKIMYRNAVQKYPTYGLAYYHLGLTEQKLNDPVNAVRAFRRAVELLERAQPQPPEFVEARVVLTDAYLRYGAVRDKELLKETEESVAFLLKRDPNSFDAHRLAGGLATAKMMRAAGEHQTDVANQQHELALAEFRKAVALKPANAEAQRDLAQVLTYGQQFAEAESIYQKLIASDKEQLINYSELFRLYNLERKTQQAEDILKLAIANNPKQHRLLFDLAGFYYVTKRDAEGDKVLADLKTHAPKEPELYRLIGDFYFRARQANKAIQTYEEGIKADAKQKVLYQKRIIELLMSQGKQEEAAQVNEQILKDNPKDNDARGLRATMLLDKGDIMKSVEQLKAVVADRPDNVVAHFNYGRALAARGDYEPARQQFAEAIRLKDDYLAPRIALSHLQMTRGEYEAGMKTADDVLQRNPANVQATLLKAQGFVGLNKLPEARAILKFATDNMPNLAEAWFQTGRLELAEKKYKEAAEDFRKTYQLDPNNVRGLNGVVETEFQLNRGEQAVVLLKSELQKAPQRLDMRLVLANAEARAKKYEDAVVNFKFLVDHLADRPRTQGDVYMRLGEVYQLKNDFPTAVEMFRRASNLLPENGLARANLALSLERSGRQPEAKKAYEDAVKADGSNWVALNNLAYLIAETGGNLDEALTYAQRARQKAPQFVEVADTLGWIYYKKGLSDNAISIFREIVSKEPNQSTFRYHLGLAYWLKRDKLQAKKELEAALKSRPAKDEEAKIKELMATIDRTA